MSAADAVRRGAELLDRVQPGWAERIDLDVLDLGSNCRCVLGQLYDTTGGDWAAYQSGLADLGIPYETDDDADYGFNLPAGAIDDADVDGAWAELDRLWTAEIRARRDTGRDGGTNGGDR